MFPVDSRYTRLSVLQKAPDYQHRLLRPCLHKFSVGVWYRQSSIHTSEIKTCNESQSKNGKNETVPDIKLQDFWILQFFYYLKPPENFHVTLILQSPRGATGVLLDSPEVVLFMFLYGTLSVTVTV